MRRQEMLGILTAGRTKLPCETIAVLTNAATKWDASRGDRFRARVDDVEFRIDVLNPNRLVVWYSNAKGVQGGVRVERGRRLLSIKPSSGVERQTRHRQGISASVAKLREALQRVL